MSTTLNQSLSTDTNDKTDRHVRLLLFGLCVTIAAATLVGGLYSLVSLLRSWRKNPLCVIVASMSVDDLLSVAPLSMFLLLQWETDGADDGGGGGGGGRGRGSSRLCTVSGLLYVFQGVSSHMKACLIAAYTFYVSRKFGVFGSVRTPVAVTWAVVGVWSVSLSVSVLPLCGWGTFTPLTLGCFPDTSGVYVMLLFSLYSLSFCGLLIFFVPLTHELLCSTEPHRILLSPACVDMSRGHGASAHSCPRDSVAKSFGAYNELSPSSCATERRGTEDSGLSPDSVRGTEDSGMSPDSVRGTEDSGLSPDSVRGTEDSGLSPDSVRGQRTAAVTHAPRLFAQKRFSMIVALLRVVLWMPMMTVVVLRHTVKTQSSSVETLSFFLTLLAPALTPVFLLSQRWIHMPCGCFINCKQDPHQQSSVMKRRLDIRLSFHQNCGVYKLSHHSLCLQKPDCYTLFNCHPLHSHLDTLQRGSGLAPGLDFSTTCPADSSSRAELLLDAAETVSDLCPDVRCVHVFPPHQREREDTDVSSVFDGPDRRVSHEDCGTMQLTDWEWCRSKSERTSRQFICVEEFFSCTYTDRYTDSGLQAVCPSPYVPSREPYLCRHQQERLCLCPPMRSAVMDSQSVQTAPRRWKFIAPNQWVMSPEQMIQSAAAARWTPMSRSTWRFWRSVTMRRPWTASPSSPTSASRPHTHARHRCVTRGGKTASSPVTWLKVLLTRCSSPPVEILTRRP
ncbi:probable G-protein coupled receptor 149 isoform X3 [Solea solea]|uniref:probable G-protein coupled receptor 149 isoform X3 n=1 Tax=Solea solea TaxID=90069 RepID=UPI00272D17B7|nr:probable G-protein coupled receptor 149 isoform X3 [Solea solea]